MSGMLSIVPTPIGNLGDITFRGVETLKNADIIAAEDTRRTKILLGHYQIDTPLISYHEHNEYKRTPELLKRIENGEHVALVSDAGTPSVSDPGYRLVFAALEKSLPVTALPGASAILPALVVSGFPTDSFVFLGFLPRKKGERRKKLEEVATFTYTAVFFESPNRVKAVLSECKSILGDRKVAICRELTKKFEEIKRGKISEILKEIPEKLKGEITIAIAPGEKEPISWAEVEEEIKKMLSEGKGVKEIATLIHESTDLSKREVYSRALKLKSMLD
ncbi:16S rRNA (cytidine(1402)-2'-O)-methyltransferase [Bdellovibrionota bacterium]